MGRSEIFGKKDFGITGKYIATAVLSPVRDLCIKAP